ncbi:MAG: anti-sigma regulatory factor [Bacteroidales bacterium]|jgi:anti-sigma regulatory factor (Ser/Thr protein kinase)|nr:anti-sigma regulatory factor [Bacteroidales bacterium]NMC13266.1 anti-sigma regulatory factor [Chloroflexota bacterium]NPV36332.1 anti-sigma regulatory factor [Bacteroidales bacterium]
MKLRFHVEGGDFSNAGAASSEVKKLLKQINVPSEIVKRIVVALYEAEVNIVAHAYEGDIEVDIQADRIDALLSDRGPGIADIELAMQEGYSTASPKVREMGFGAGMGLPNIRKNTDVLNIESTPGKGTNVSFTVFFQTKS